MAVASGVGVSVIYLPQPVQTLVAEEFFIPLESSTAPNTAMLAGYALGILLLLPLADRVPARRQAPVHIVVTAIAIAVVAAAPTYAVFVALNFVIGMATTVGQILIAAALRGAPPSSRATTAAVISGSFLVGLFTTRVVEGAMADVFGWRFVFLAFAVIVLACLPLVLWAAPRDAASPGTSYAALMRSLPGIALNSAALRAMTVTHVLAFGTFISVWSTVTVLAVDRLGLTVSEAALLALAGLAGGITTIVLAPLHRHLGLRRAMGAALVPLVAGAVTIMIGWNTVPLLLLGLYLVSLGLSSSQVSTQASALDAAGRDASGRANTIFMTTAFFIGAVVVGGSEILMNALGYGAIGLLATILATLAVVMWIRSVRLGVL